LCFCDCWDYPFAGIPVTVAVAPISPAFGQSLLCPALPQKVVRSSTQGVGSQKWGVGESFLAAFFLPIIFAV
jgi:hypothetical protein